MRRMSCAFDRTARHLAGAAGLFVFALTACDATAADFRWIRDPKSCAAPDYPRDAIRAREQGKVVWRFQVGVDGTVVDAELESSSRSRKLDDAARKALSKCTFKPSPPDAKPQQQWVRVEWDWVLDD